VIPIYVGYDSREAVGYSVFCHSVLSRTKARVSFHPVRGEKVVGSTQFNAERFSIARECGYRGWAVWAESDMLCLADIEELMEYADPYCDVVVAKHDYRTKHPVKFLGQANEDYPRKNWSSLMLVNCGHAAWERLAHKSYTLPQLHRFEFLDEARIGALPLEWNHLVGEYAPNPVVKLAHFTIGLPIWAPYSGWEYAADWHRELAEMLDYEGAPV
jgi:hypothetical protein